jgi:hypothetical protein
MSHKGQSTSRHQANTSSTHQATNPSAWVTPRYTPPLRYDEFITALNGAARCSASSGTGDLSHYQSSSSARGQVADTTYCCLMVYATWACGHQTAEPRRHRLCWKCSNLDADFCNPEPVEIDRTSECRACKERHEEERRQRHRARAAALEEIRRGQLMELNLQRDSNTQKRKRSL